MAVRDRSWAEIEWRTSSGFRTTRYDVYLAAIPLLFVAAILIGLLVSVPMESSVLGASLLSVAILTDGLFVNPPDVGDSR